ASRLAEIYEPTSRELAAEMALHYQKGHEFERAIECLILSSEAANQKFAYRDSIQLLENGLALTGRIPADRRSHARMRIIERIGDVFYAMGDMKRSAQAFDDCAACAAEIGALTEEVNALSCLARTTVPIDGDLGIGAGERARAACGRTQDPLLIARTELLTASLRLGYDR